MRKFILGLIAGISLASCTKPVEKELIPAISAKDLRAKISEPGAAVTVVNIWATWCEPCKAEMPELVAFHKNNLARGARLLLVNADDPKQQSEALQFLKKAGVDFPTYRFGETPDLFVKNFEPRWMSTLPATFIFDSHGQQTTFWVGQTTEKELKSKTETLFRAHLATTPKIESDRNLPSTGTPGRR